MPENPYAAALAWLGPLAPAFGGRTWRRALVLIAGAVLAQGPRTVASALRAVGLGAAPGFGSYHRVLSRRRWSGRVAARRAARFQCWSCPQSMAAAGQQRTARERRPELLRVGMRSAVRLA